MIVKLASPLSCSIWCNSWAAVSTSFNWEASTRSCDCVFFVCNRICAKLSFKVADGLKLTLPAIRPGVVAAALFSFVSSFGNLEMSLFLVGPGRTTLPIAIIQYLEWKIDPTIAAVSVLQIGLIGAAMLVTDRFVRISRMV